MAETTINGTVEDSKGVPLSGYAEFTATAVVADGTLLVPNVKVTVQVTGGVVEPTPIRSTEEGWRYTVTVYAQNGPKTVPVHTLRDVAITGASMALSQLVPALPAIPQSTADVLAARVAPLETAVAELPLTYALKGEGLIGSNVGRFLKRAQAGEDLKLVALGDSVLEGLTVTNPATDGTMPLLAADLTARFPGTITQTNYANSGYTTAAAFINGKVRDALAAQGDLYVIGFGKNDTGWEREPASDHPVPGYPTASSVAMLEQMLRLIRADVPKADIVVLAENPYTPLLSAANDLLRAYHDAARRVAAAYGAEFVDAYAPFAAADDLAALVPDGTHPGTAGHRLMADTLLEHLPADYAGPALAPGRPAAKGLHDPQNIDTTTDLRGWISQTAPGTSGLGKWANVGSGWAGSGPRVTSQAGDYAEFTFTGTELLLTVSTLAADAPVVTVTVDGVGTYTARSLTGGKQGAEYPVPFVTGLTPGRHTVRVTLVSGALKIHRASWTEAGTDGDVTSYTPVWTAATTNPVYAPGVVTGRWSRDRRVDCEIIIVPDAATAFGNGAYTITLPVAADITMALATIGTVVAWNSGVGFLIGAVQLLTPTTARIAFHGDDTPWGPASPWVFKNGDYMRVTLRYLPA